MNSLAPKLEEWVAMWRVALPGFEVDSLWGEGPLRWAPLDVSPVGGDIEHQDTEDDLAFRILRLRSPDGSHILDVDSYQSIEPDGDSLQVGGEPDSRCTLIDLTSKTEAILQFCGTPCAFHWGVWLSPTRFAVGGWYDPNGFDQWWQGTLSIYSLRDSTVAEYRTRIVPVGDAARYSRAWHRWLLKRYRALMASHPRT